MKLEEYGSLIALLATPLGAALSGLVVMLDGALVDWFGPRPPPGLTRDGQVPTGRLPTVPGYHLATPAGEVSTVAREPSKL